MKVIEPEAWQPSDLVFVRGRRTHGVVAVELSPRLKRTGPLAQWELDLMAKGYPEPSPDVQLWEVIMVNRTGDVCLRRLALNAHLTILRMDRDEIEADLA